MKKLYLVDCSSLFFRAYYAIRPLTSPSGLPVNAIYGYLSMLIKLIKNEKPDLLAFCYDLKEPSFRKDLYADYKSNRSEMPEDLAKQMPYIKDISRLLGIKSFEKFGYEADDLIGSLTVWGLKNNLEVIIVSGDKDFAQLVTPHVYLYDTMKETRMGPNEIKSKWEVTPEQFIDYLAIVGDSSDHVPGVKGIGPKGAVKLINDFGTLEGVYENIEKIDGKLKEKLIQNRELAFLSKVLVTIKTDVLSEEEISSLEYKINVSDELIQWLESLNFKTFKKSIEDLTQVSSRSEEIPSAQIKPAVKEQSEFVALDATRETDFSSLYYFINDNSIYGASPENKVFLINPNILKESLNENFKWTGYDLKTIWKQLGIPMQWTRVQRDTMLYAYVKLSKDCTSFEKTFKNIFNEELDPKLSPGQMGQCLKRLDDFFKELNDVALLDALVGKLENPLIAILYKMETRGCLVDTQFLNLFGQELAIELAAAEKEIHQSAGESFNVASPKQLGVILFEKLKLPVGRKTKTGYSTDTDVLEKLDHPIAKMILNYRELAKLKSTYVDVLPTLVSKHDLRLHTTYNQALTTTGRLSSSDPNLQNIPIKTARGQKIRRAFIASPGKKLLSVDYSQIELRILAHISEDRGLIHAFENNLDVHAATAAEVFGVPLGSVSTDMRRVAKAVNFGIAYGQGAFGLSETLGISRTEATEIIANYFKKFPGVRSYIETTTKVAHENGYVETLFGRRRHIDELSSKNQMLRKFGERAAINAPIQGSASDIMKVAMIRLDAEVKSDMILQVHDEIIFEDTEVQLNSELPIIVKIMESVMPLRVPLVVNSKIALNWDEAH